MLASLLSRVFKREKKGIKNPIRNVFIVNLRSIENVKVLQIENNEKLQTLSKVCAAVYA